MRLITLSALAILLAVSSPAGADRTISQDPRRTASGSPGTCTKLPNGTNAGGVRRPRNIVCVASHRGWVVHENGEFWQTIHSRTTCHVPGRSRVTKSSDSNAPQLPVPRRKWSGRDRAP